MQTPSLTGELTIKEQQKFLDCLHDRDKFVYLDKGSVSAYLRQLWEQDLYCSWVFDVDVASLSAYIYEAFPESEAKCIVQQLCIGKDLEYVSRTTLISLAQHVFDHIVGEGQWDQDKIKRRISWLYLFATAIAADCDLYVYGFNSSSSPEYSNLGLYLRTLKSVGITSEILRNLSVDDIITIRHSEEYRTFIMSYRSLLVDTKIITETQATWLFSKLSKSAELPWYWKMASKAQKLRDACMGVATGLLVNYLGGTPLNVPIAGAFGGAIGVIGVTSILNRIAKVNTKLSISNFKEYMITNFSKSF